MSSCRLKFAGGGGETHSSGQEGLALALQVIDNFGEHAISLFNTLFHWSSGPPVSCLSWGTRVQSPGGYLCETGILLLALSRYIGDPDVIDHCGLVQGRLHPEPSLGRHANNVIIPLDTALLSRFHARCRSSFRLHNWCSRLLGGSPVESLQSLCIHTQFLWSSGPSVCFPSWGIQGVPCGKLGLSC